MLNNINVTEDYYHLAQVLALAYEQSSSGKGKNRHANGKPFLEQPIMEIGRMVGIGYQLGQAMKKAQEAGGMASRGEILAAQAELLGAINYLAAAHIQLDEMAYPAAPEAAPAPDTPKAEAKAGAVWVDDLCRSCGRNVQKPPAAVCTKPDLHRY